MDNKFEKGKYYMARFGHKTKKWIGKFKEGTDFSITFFPVSGDWKKFVKNSDGSVSFDRRMSSDDFEEVEIQY